MKCKKDGDGCGGHDAKCGAACHILVASKDFHAIRQKMNPNWVLSTSDWRKLSRVESQMPAKGIGYRVERKKLFGEKVSPDRKSR